MQWEDCRSDPLGRYAENGRQSGGRKTGRDAWEAGDGDWDSGRGRSGPPKLAGDFDAGEEFEPPKKRAVSDLRSGLRTALKCKIHIITHYTGSFLKQGRYTLSPASMHYSTFNNCDGRIRARLKL